MSGSNSELLTNHADQHETTAQAELLARDWTEEHYFNLNTEAGHGHEGPCGPNCSHNQQEADRYADSLFEGLDSSPETSHGHRGPCGPECSHNNVEADRIADSLFADLLGSENEPLKPTVEKTSVDTDATSANKVAEELSHEVKASGHDHEGPCGPNCSHNQQEADRYADSLFEGLDSNPIGKKDASGFTEKESLHKASSPDKIVTSDQIAASKTLAKQETLRETELSIAHQINERLNEPEVPTVSATETSTPQEGIPQERKVTAPKNEVEQYISSVKTVVETSQHPSEILNPIAEPSEPIIETTPGKNLSEHTIDTLQESLLLQQAPLIPEQVNLSSGTQDSAPITQLGEFNTETMQAIDTPEQPDVNHYFATVDNEDDTPTAINPIETLGHTGDVATLLPPEISTPSEEVRTPSENEASLKIAAQPHREAAIIELTNSVPKEEVGDAIAVVDIIIAQLEVAMVNNETINLQNLAIASKLHELSEKLSVEYAELADLILNAGDNEQNLDRRLYEILKGLRRDLSIEYSYEYSQKFRQQAQKDLANTPKNIGQLIIAILTRRLQTDNATLAA